MEPLECLNKIDAIVANAPGTRSDHDQLRVMVACIRNALTPKPPEKQEPATPEAKGE